jgi:hypothetical protein
MVFRFLATSERSFNPCVKHKARRRPSANLQTLPCCLLLLVAFGDQDVYTSTSHWPLQGSKCIGVYPFLVYTCFPMICAENNNHRGAKCPCGARRRRDVVVLCAKHWKTGIHQKQFARMDLLPWRGQKLALVYTSWSPMLVVVACCVDFARGSPPPPGN